MLIGKTNGEYDAKMFIYLVQTYSGYRNYLNYSD
jgi:hypothetical protein